jgi:hypothetical protein
MVPVAYRIEMSLRKKGYTFLAFVFSALVSISSLFVYWGIYANGIDTLKVYKEFASTRYTIKTLWGWPSPIMGIPGMYGWIPVMGCAIPFWLAPALAIFGSVLAVMNLYQLADFHRQLILGFFAASALIAIAAGIFMMSIGALVPGYSFSLIPPVAGFIFTIQLMKPTDRPTQ